MNSHNWFLGQFDVHIVNILRNTPSEQTNLRHVSQEWCCWHEGHTMSLPIRIYVQQISVNTNSCTYEQHKRKAHQNANPSKHCSCAKYVSLRGLINKFKSYYYRNRQRSNSDFVCIQSSNNIYSIYEYTIRNRTYTFLLVHRHQQVKITTTTLYQINTHPR